MQEKIKSLDRDIQNTIATIDENNEAITESYNKRIRKIEEEVTNPLNSFKSPQQPIITLTIF